MCQNDSPTGAAKAFEAVRVNACNYGLSVVYKTFRFDGVSRKVYSTVRSEYLWAPGWNAPKFDAWTAYKRSACGIHAFVEAPLPGTLAPYEYVVPLLVRMDEILHYGSDNEGKATILASRLYLPQQSWEAVGRRRHLLRLAPRVLGSATVWASDEAQRLRNGKGKINTGFGLAYPDKPAKKHVKAKKRKK